MANSNRKNSDAERIFQKNQEDMSEIERMMADILNEYNEEQKAENEPEEEPFEDLEPVYASPSPPVRLKPRRGRPVSASSPQEESREVSPKISRSRDAEREKNIKEASRKRSGTWAVVTLVLVILLVLGTIIYTRVFEDIRERGILPSMHTAEPTESPEEIAALATVTFPPDMVFPTPEPEDAVQAGTIRPQAPAGSIVIMSDTTPAPSPDLQSEPREHSYEFYTEDVSWSQARQKCLDRGGHLAVVSSAQELDEITALAAANGIQKVWLGCHRENGTLIWENGETVDFYAWGRGEPSLYDSGDNVAEDCLLLWYFNGAWVYNDSRDDPVRDYPQMYSGQIGYVCEYD